MWFVRYSARLPSRDDPVTKFLPNFTHPSSGWSDFLRGDSVSANSPITLRQLASHLSGLGRDYPPEDVGEPWPRPLHAGAKEDELQTFIDEGTEEFLRAVAKYPLVAPQYTFPVYSNTGFNLLGLCNLAADESATGKERTYPELLQDDVFDPLGLNSSFYEIPNSRLAAQIAVPSSNSELAVCKIPSAIPVSWLKQPPGPLISCRSSTQREPVQLIGRPRDGHAKSTVASRNRSYKPVRS